MATATETMAPRLKMRYEEEIRAPCRRSSG